MTTNQKITTGIVVLIVLVLGLVFPRGHSVVQQVVGSVASPDIQSPYFSVGGQRFWASHPTINQASTTLCAIQSPVATSTLIHAGVSATTGTTTVLAVEIGKDKVDPTATTTRLSWANTTSGSKWTITYASTTVISSGTITPDQDNVFGPSQWLVFKAGGYAGSANVLVGQCSAVFVQNSGY